MENKELVLREEDNKLVYVDNKSKKELTLFEKLLSTDEFRREPTRGVVVDEDLYLSHLEKLITRDYFPFLNNSNTNTDKSKIDESVLSPISKLRNLNKEYEDTFKTQSSKDYDLSKFNVDTYLANFNSDELESFKDVIFKDKKKKLMKLLWIYKQSNYHNNKMAELKEYSEEFLKLSANTTEEKKFESANLNYSLSDPKNHFMFPAAGNFNHKNCLDEEKSRFSENIVIEKEIIKENTRLPENFVEGMMQKSAFNMRKSIFENYENSDHAKILREAKIIDLEVKNANKQSNLNTCSTPMVNGYKFLKDPVPEPGIIDNVPLMTWGEIASTPMVLKVNNDNKFTIPQTPLREKVAHNLTIKQNDKKNKAVNLKSVKSNNQTYEFTPNAYRLLNSVKRNNSNIFDEPTSVIRNDNTFLSRKRLGSNIISIKSTVKCKETPKNNL